MKNKKLAGTLLLLLAAFIWGTAFVFQKVGMEYIKPFTFNGIRTVIGGLALLPVALISSRRSKKDSGILEPVEKEKLIAAKKNEKRMLYGGGAICGIILFAGSSLQQFGLNDPATDAGKAGFITALYVLLVPIASIILGKRVRPIIWACAAAGGVGLYLLCMKGGSFTMSSGDICVLLCAFVYTFHIMAIDYVSPHVNGIELSCVQFFVAGALGIISMLIFERQYFDINALLACAPSLLYVAILSSGVGYTLQILGQRSADPAVASLAMSFESVFAALAGAVLLKETMSAREIIGCVIMFAAIVIAQLPEKKKKQDQQGNL